MKKLLLLSALILTCALSVFSQKKRVKIHLDNTILAAVLKNLAEPTVCGTDETPPTEIFFGTIVKRNFEENEVALSGIVIADAKDRRTFINFDTEHISGLAASSTGDLADGLLKGLKVKVWAYRCGRIYFARKIQEQ